MFLRDAQKYPFVSCFKALGQILESRANIGHGMKFGKNLNLASSPPKPMQL
jgi:hypothetical protein